MRQICFGLILQIVCFSTFAVYAQSIGNPPEDSLVLIKEIKQYQTEKVFVSKTQQIYVLTPDNEILRIDTSGKILFRYNNNYIGTPQFIYFENPLQIALFYESYQTILILDQWMNELKRISLQSLNIPFVQTIGVAPDRTIWYFDDQVKRLKKINQEGKLVFESPLFVTDQNAAWKSIVNRKNDLILQSKSGKIFILNLFGQLKAEGDDLGDIKYYGMDNIITSKLGTLHYLTISNSQIKETKQISLAPVKGNITLWSNQIILEVTAENYLRFWRM